MEGPGKEGKKPNILIKENNTLLQGNRRLSTEI